jgi:dTMP kinase
VAGLFITMEGIEGSGKSTQIRRLADRLTGVGIPVEVSKEPGGTALCRELRQLLLEPHASREQWCPKSEVLLFYADRAQHLAEFVAPALEAGHLVLLDRFDDSTRAYQGAQGIGETLLDRLGEAVLGRLRPNLTLLLDMDPETALARVQARNAAVSGFRETRFDQEHLDFHRQVRQRFLAIAHKEPQRVAVIPAQDDPEVVAAAIWSRLAPLLRGAGLPVD